MTMNPIRSAYRWLHRRSCRTDGQPSYSAGRWQDLIRQQAGSLCAGCRGRLLEVGCGEGLFLRSLARDNPGLRLYGIDRSEERIRQAAGMQALVADGLRLPFSAAAFDCVVCVNVLFNLSGAEQVLGMLREAARVCRPQGTIVFDVRNRAHPLLRLKYRLAGWYDETVRDLPLKTYSLEQIRSFCSRAGMTIRQVRPLGMRFGTIAPLLLVKAVKP